MRYAPPRAAPDAVLRSLSHPVRRLVVSELQAADRPVRIDRLAERCRSSDPAALDHTPHQVHVSLQHVHLPALDDAGLVEYDRADGEICLDERADARLDDVIEELERLR